MEQLEERRVLAADLTSVMFEGAANEELSTTLASYNWSEVAPQGVASIEWAGQPANVWQDEWQVQFTDVVGSGEEQVATLSARLAEAYPEGGYQVLQWLGADGQFLIIGPEGATFEQVQQSLSSHFAVDVVEPNFVLQSTALPNDSAFGALWGMHNVGQFIGQPGIADADIDAPEAWDHARGSRSVTVGVIDSGIDYSHPDLYLNIWINEAEIPSAIRSALTDADGDGLITFVDLNNPVNIGAGKIHDYNGNGRIDGGDLLHPASGWENFVDNDVNGFVDDLIGWDFANNDNDPLDDHNHGTHVSGTLGGIGNNALGVTGVNWEISLMGLKFLRADNFGSIAHAVQATNYANMMRDRGVNIRATNNSWGGGGLSAPLQDAIEGHRARNMLFVAAAGNGNYNNDASPSYPASYPQDNIIAVAGTDNRDGKYASSQWGLNSVDIAGPAVNVLSSVRGGGYAYFNGTSMATPHVTGAAALLWSVDPDLSYAEVREAIFNSGDPVYAYRTDGPTPIKTGRRLNLFGALEAIGGTGIRVESTEPAVDSTVVGAAPTDFVVNFTRNYAPATIQPDDFTVNGIAADSVTLVDTNTVTFHYGASPAAEGLNTMAIAAGALTDTNNYPSNVFSEQFRYDSVGLQPTTTNPPFPGGVFTLPGPFTYVVNFNEEIDPASVGIDDLTLSAGVVSGAVASGPAQATYMLTGITSEELLDVTLAAGKVTDTFGNGNSDAFAATYEVDIGAVPYPVPLTAEEPLGSLIYDPSFDGLIGSADDVDTFTLAVDAGQTITVLVDPVGSLAPTVELHDPADVLLASDEALSGENALLQTIPATTGGVYTIRVGGAGASIGDYTVRVILNAALETESNDSRAEAQDINGSFLNLQPSATSATRGAVMGALTPAKGSAVNLITNGGFETGNFSGWTISGQWAINNGSLDPFSPATPRAPILGSFDAITNPSGGGFKRLDQSFVVPQTFDRATLSWSDRIQSFTAFADPNHEFRVQILGLGFTQTIYSTNPGDPQTQLGPNQRSVDITSVLQSRAGQTLQLRFEQQDSFYLNVTVDDIVLSVEGIPAGPESDFYSVDLAAGQSVHLAASLSNAAPSGVAFGPREDFMTPGLPGQTGTIPLEVAYRDLNGDGKLDMVSANGGSASGPNAAGSIAVRLGNGDGTFGAPSLFPTNGLFTRFLDFGDVNGDGKLDVVASNDDSNSVSLLLGNGDGTFNSAFTRAVNANPLGLRVGDLNGDGRDDVVVPHFGSGNIAVLLGQADGTLSPASFFSVGSSAPFTVDVGDVNNDGRPDVVTANFTAASMSVLLGNGAGGFGSPTVLTGQGNNPWGIVLADLDGDNDLDVITGNQGSANIAVRLGNGNGSFSTPSFFSTGGNGPRTVALGDVNGDGKLDVAVPNIGSTNVAVLPGNGNGTFGAPLLYSTSPNPNYATLADVNGDGLDDLSTADAGTQGQGRVTLRLNTTPAVRLELQDSAGNVVAVGSSGADNYDAGLQYVAPAAGTYYIRVVGARSTSYNLVALTDAAFDTETNTSFDAAQDITGLQGALGHLSTEGGVVTSVLYTTGNDGSALIAIDQATGVATTVGPLGFSQSYAAAFTPDGTLWTIVDGYNSASARLATVNLTTGAATPVGSPLWTGAPLIALEADAAGNLYGGNWNGAFFSIDTTTGQATALGSLGFGGLMDFAFDQTGTLWAVDHASRLYRVNPATGASTFQSTITGVNGPVMGLMVDPATNIFYATTYTSNAPLYQVNPMNGVTTAVGAGLGSPFPHGGDFQPRNTIAITAFDSGWWNSFGDHNANNTNYLVGKAGAAELRNFVTFNLAGISQDVSSAVLVLTNGLASRGPGYVSQDPSETFMLHDVSTPISTLTTSGTGQTDIFEDLGDGVSFGTRDFTPADNHRHVPITLTAEGLAALNAALGGPWALGGSVTTISGTPDQAVFAYTGNPNDIKQLVLAFEQPEDWYSIEVTDTAHALRLETSTPADGSGEFVNELNPRIELYDPNNNLVASGAALPDGRNERIIHTPRTTGTYRVRMVGEGNSRGEYFLSKNFAPALTDLALSQTEIDESGSVTVTGKILDPDARDTHTVEVDWGDGTTSLAVVDQENLTFTATHQYVDDHPTGTPADDYTIDVTVADSHGATGNTLDSVFEGDFFTTHDFGTRLGTVDLATGVGAEIGPFGTEATWAAAFDMDGTLYTLFDGFGNARLGVVDQTTGAVTPIGSGLGVPMINLEIASDGTMFGIGYADGVLYRIDKVLGAATPVGDTGVLSSMDLAFDSAGTLYATVANQLFTVDTTSGASTLLGPITGISQGHVMGIAFGADDTLYATVYMPDSPLYAIDVNTRAAAVVGGTGLFVPHGGDILLTHVPAESLSVTVNNVAPAIDGVELSSASINEGDSVTVSGTFSDPGLGAPTESFTGTARWSDGVTTPLTLVGNTFSASRSFPDDDPTGTRFDTFTVDISLSDDDGGASDIATSPVLTVNNVDPSIDGLSTDATLADPAVENAIINIASAFSDVGVLDTHTVTIDWGDESASADVVTEADGSGTLAGSHVYAAGGVYTVTVTLVDDDGGEATAATTAVVTGVGIVDGVLYIVGTNNDDAVHVNLVDHGGEQVLRVHANFLASDRDIPVADFEAIKVLLLDGDDHATLAGNTGIPAILDGGDGSDTLNAGAGPTVVLGGAGNDFLQGGGGRDILIGGEGADNINGNSNEDILIAGTTDYDGNDAALLLLLEEWTRPMATSSRTFAPASAISVA